MIVNRFSRTILILIFFTINSGACGSVSSRLSSLSLSPSQSSSFSSLNCFNQENSRRCHRKYHQPQHYQSYRRRDSCNNIRHNSRQVNHNNDNFNNHFDANGDNPIEMNGGGVGSSGGGKNNGQLAWRKGNSSRLDSWPGSIHWNNNNNFNNDNNQNSDNSKLSKNGGHSDRNKSFQRFGPMKYGNRHRHSNNNHNNQNRNNNNNHWSNNENDGGGVISNGNGNNNNNLNEENNGQNSNTPTTESINDIEKFLVGKRKRRRRRRRRKRSALWMNPNLYYRRGIGRSLAGQNANSNQDSYEEDSNDSFGDGIYGNNYSDRDRENHQENGNGYGSIGRYGNQRNRFPFLQNRSNSRYGSNGLDSSSMIPFGGYQSNNAGNGYDSNRYLPFQQHNLFRNNNNNNNNHNPYNLRRFRLF